MDTTIHDLYRRMTATYQVETIDRHWWRLVDAAIARRDAKQPCGHPVMYVRSSDEGTQYCAMCAPEASK